MDEVQLRECFLTLHTGIFYTDFTDALFRAHSIRETCADGSSFAHHVEATVSSVSKKAPLRNSLLNKNHGDLRSLTPIGGSLWQHVSAIHSTDSYIEMYSRKLCSTAYAAASARLFTFNFARILET